MQVNLENEKENVIKLDFTVPAKEAETAYDSAAKRIAQYINVDGFRKGKAPKAVVERHVGTDRIKMEVIENMMPKLINQAIEENKLDVIAQPYVSSYTFNMGEDLKIVAKVEVRPEVTLGQYKDLNLKVEEVEMPEKAFDQALENVMGQFATMENVTDRESKETDTVVIDFDGYSNGEKIVGGEAKNYPLDLAHSNFIPGFAEQLVGKNAGDEFEIEVKFPDEYHDEKLKGQPATFKIKVHEIKERKMPELNDELASKVGPFKSVDELKADIQKYIDNQKETGLKRNKENVVFDAVVGSAKMEIPETMIDREVGSLTEEYKQRLAQQGISWDTVVKNQSQEEILKNIREDAISRIKNSLVIDKIAKEENLKLEQKDLEQKFSELAAVYGMPANELIKQLGRNPEALAGISQQAMNDKVRDFLLENNKFEVTALKKSKKAE